MLLSTLKNNVTRGRVTTALGAVLFMATLASVFLVPGISWGDASTCLLLGLALILMPDRVLRILRDLLGRRAGLLLLPACLSLSSCASGRLPGCQRLYGEQRVDTVRVITHALVPADSATLVVHRDSLLQLLDFPWTEARRPELVSSSHTATATVSRVGGSREHLRVNCRCRETVIRDTATVYVERTVFRPAGPTVVVREPSWGEQARAHPVRWLLLPALSLAGLAWLAFRGLRPRHRVPAGGGVPYRKPTQYPFL